MRPEQKEHLTKEYFFLKDISIGVGSGWFSILDDLCKELLTFVPAEFKVTQIKEKFGGLRFYYELKDHNHYDITYSSHISYEDFRQKVNGLIAKAESLSYETCELCGDPASLDKSSFWMKSLCEFHKLERREGS